MSAVPDDEWDYFYIPSSRYWVGRSTRSDFDRDDAMLY